MNVHDELLAIWKNVQKKKSGVREIRVTQSQYDRYAQGLPLFVKKFHETHFGPLTFRGIPLKIME